MDETNDLPESEEMTVDEELAEPSQEEAEPVEPVVGDVGCECDQEEAEAAKSTCCKCGRPGLLRGLMMGAAAGGFAARMMARKKEERRMRSGIPGEGEGEGHSLPQGAIEKVEGMACGVVARAKAAWVEFRLRLRDAVEEGKEGIGEGQEEARLRYEHMTRRRRHGGRRN